MLNVLRVSHRVLPIIEYVMPLRHLRVDRPALLIGNIIDVGRCLMLHTGPLELDLTDQR